MLIENCSSPSVYNEVKHKAEISVGEEIRDPKQLWNLRNNINKTKRQPRSNSGEKIELLRQ